MPRKAKSRIFIVVLVTVLLLAFTLLSAWPGSPLNMLTTPLSAVLQPIQSALIWTSDKVGGFFESISEGMRLRDENQSLKDENADLRSQIAQLEDAGRQYQELKDAFLLKDQFDQYEVIGARVMTREIGAWFDVFRIDAGTRDGLAVSETLTFAVVDAQSRLIGRVLSTDVLSGKVLPLLHEGFAVSAKINVVNGSLMRVRGDFDLKPQGLCLVDQIPQNSGLQVGDELVTSGAGGLFPAGIPIGKITRIVEQESGNERTAYLQPYADLQNLTTLFILKGRDE